MVSNEEQLDELEAAVRNQAENLDPAQRGFVLSEFRTYRWNAMKIFDIEEHINGGFFDPDIEKKAIGERHQLVTENASLFTHIMQWLKGTATEQSALEDFLGTQ